MFASYVRAYPRRNICPFTSVQTNQSSLVNRQIPSLYTSANNTAVDVLCMQVLDASLGLISMPEMIGSLEHLLKQTENNVSNYTHRPGVHSLHASDPSASTSITATSSHRQKTEFESFPNCVFEVPIPTFVDHSRVPRRDC